MSKQDEPMSKPPPPVSNRPPFGARATREAQYQPLAYEPEPADLKAPQAWREALGTPPQEYGPAEVLHLWPTHAMHANGGKEMSKEDYLAAIDAARAPDELGNYIPHEAALSDYEADGSPHAHTQAAGDPAERKNG